MTGSSHDERAARRAALPARDLIAGAAILVFCAVAYAITLTIAKAPAALAQNVQPASFPRLVIGTIAVLALIMMGLSFARPGKPAGPVPLLVPVTGAMMIGFVVAFDVLGIVSAMILFCFVMPLLWGERRWLLVLPLALLFPAAVYAIFALIFDVHFDSGILSFV